MNTRQTGVRFFLLRGSCGFAVTFAALTLHAGLLYDVDDYVQEGLVVMLDAPRNAGTNAVHDANATTWVNLAGGGGATKTAYTGTGKNSSGTGRWLDNAFYMDADYYFKTIGNIPASESVTVEVFGDFTPTQPTQYPNFISIADGGSSTDCGIWMNGGALKWKLDSYGFSTRPTISSWDKQGFAAALDASQVVLYASGTTVSNTQTGRTSGKTFPACQWNIGCNWKAGDHPVKGTYYAVRIYTNALTQAQIENNWEIDQYRFITGIPKTNVVIATATSGVYGYEIPGAYAIDDEGYTFSTPSSVTVDGVQYTSSGYTIAEWDSDKGDWSSSTTTYNTQSYTHTDTDEKVLLTWQWASAPTFDRTPAIVAAADGLSVSYKVGSVAATSVEVFGSTDGETWTSLGSNTSDVDAGAFGSVSLSSFSGTQTLKITITGTTGSYLEELGNAYNGALTLSATNAKEADLSAAVVTITRTGSATLPLTVNFATTDGTAASGTDFKALSANQATIAAGETSATVKIKPIFNSAKTDDTTFTFALSSGNYWSDVSATVTIENSETVSGVLLRDGFYIATDNYKSGGWRVTGQPAVGLDDYQFGFAEGTPWFYNHYGSSSSYNSGGDMGFEIANTTLSFPAKYPLEKQTGAAHTRGYPKTNQNKMFREIDADVLGASCDNLYFAFLMNIGSHSAGDLTEAPTNNQNRAFGAGIVNSYLGSSGNESQANSNGVWASSWYNTTGFMFEFARDCDDAGKFAIYLVSEASDSTFDPDKHNYLKLVDDAQTDTTYMCVAELTRTASDATTFTIRAAALAVPGDGSKAPFDKNSFRKVVDANSDSLQLPLLDPKTSSTYAKKPNVAVQASYGDPNDTNKTDAYFDEFVIATDLDLIAAVKSMGLTIIIR